MRASAFRARRGTVCVAVLAIMAVCSSFPGNAEQVDIKPVQTKSSDPALLSDEGVYQDAVREIKARNYSGALDFLQVALSRSPGDVRVLNAMGVVYDKLGRFDLSARYYTEAQKLSPDSKIVQNNMAYSATLQKALHAAQMPSVKVAEEKKAPLPVVAQRPLETAIEAPGKAVPENSAVPPNALKVAQTPVVKAVEEKTAPAPFVAQPPAEEAVPVKAAQQNTAPVQQDVATEIPPEAKAWTGLSILDASGTGTGSQLANIIKQQGWTMPAKLFASVSQQRFTTIAYGSADTAIAMSIASALPVPSRLELCEQGCHGIIVIVGQDAHADIAGTLQVAETGMAAARQ